MSYNVTHKGPGKDVDGRHEQLVAIEANRQATYTGPSQAHLQRVALEATLPFVAAVTKHARHGDTHEVNVSTNGHFNADGTGSVSLTVQISLTPAPEEPKAEGE